jgi:hypothetical protein
MATQTSRLEPPLGPPPDSLQNGDRLTQPEFHALYAKMPEDCRAELIQGIVYMASPVKAAHAESHLAFGALFTMYTVATPGVRAADNASVILSKSDEPQPDLHLRILVEYGGRVELDDDGYLVGGPELVCEVSDSTRSLDLNSKRLTYLQAGVKEYLVVNLHDQRLHWFDLATNQELSADSDGVLRMRQFPGFWIDSKAVFPENLKQLFATLNAGLASPEHAAFVAKLAAAKTA